jgi:glycosyltransferase involved in cell wall biosynthesis
MKLMVIVLTSGNIKYAIRAVESIKNQDNHHNFEYDIYVNANTTNPEYYQQVYNTFSNDSDITVVQTKSNGYPGKGHNSCLELYYQHRDKYQYMTFLDGDDLFFPCAFQQYTKLLQKKPNIDLVHLMINDNITTRVKEHEHIKLHGNFYLYTAKNLQVNWWHRLKIDNPYVQPLKECRTPSRILLVNNKIFDDQGNSIIRYSEECRLYDDFKAFLGVCEAQKNGVLNTCVLSDPNIYCYNAENDEGATFTFTTEYHQTEQETFNKEKMEYSALQNWDYLKEMPWEHISIPTNFNLNQRVNFCNNHVVQFEVNYRMERATEEFQRKEWAKARNLYKRVLATGGLSGKVSYNLGVCYHHTGHNNEAISSLHDALNLFRAQENQTILLSCLKTLSQLYFQEKRYHEVCKYALEGLKITGNSVNLGDSSVLQNIYTKALQNLSKNTITKQHVKRNIMTNKKPVLCIYTGYSDAFNGANYQERPVYGSEISAVHLAEKLATEYNVFVFCVCKADEEICVNNVQYYHLSKFQSFQNQVHINIMIVSRFIHFFYSFCNNADKTYLWVHDARSHEAFQGERFENYGAHFFNNIAPSLTGIICVSEWHERYFKHWSKISPMYYHKISVIENGIDPDYFQTNPVKTKNRFIYCSDPTRGLDILLDRWNDIRKQIPDATLDIYFSKLSPELQTKVDLLKGVKFNGKIPEKQLCNELCKADVFFYPNKSHETYGIVAHQAITAGCIVVCRRFSGLITTVGDAGKLISGNPETTSWQDKAINYIITVLKNEPLKHQLQTRARTQGLNGTWDDRHLLWQKLLKQV